MSFLFDVSRGPSSFRNDDVSILNLIFHYIRFRSDRVRCAQNVPCGRDAVFSDAAKAYSTSYPLTVVYILFEIFTRYTDRDG